MIVKLNTQVILVIIYLVTLLTFLQTYYKIQQALQWWSSRQSLKLYLEAKEIRDSLLQESFTIRRSLDLLAQDQLNFTTHKTQEYLKQADNFHHALMELSDRLFPAYIQDSLPLAIECLLEPWLTANSYLHFHLDIPAYWRSEPADRSLIVLRALEELLILTLPNFLAYTSIFISLKQHKYTGQLNVQITYSDLSTASFYYSLKELKYLCTSFGFLTSGKCVCRRRKLSITCYFSW